MGSVGKDYAMKINAKKLLIGSGIVAAGTAAVGTGLRAASGYFVRLAMDRQGPARMEERIEKVSGSKTNPSQMEAVIQGRAQLEAADTETVEIESHDGLRLVGHWYPAAQPKRILVAMHGWRSCWARDFGVVTPFWHANGCSVLYAEQRGQGESGGEYMGFGMLERHDCLRWAQWAQAHNPDRLPLYLVGVSMGATTVLMTGGMELPKAVRGIIADCGFTSAHAIWRHVAEENLHLRYGFYAAAANDLCKKKIQMDPRDYSTVDAMAECTVPVLFVHGTDDSFVPITMTYENYKACPGKKHLLVVPGAEHAMSYCTDRPLYEKTLLDFWKTYDQ